ncbi:MAG: ribosomal protein S18-alanine N-acetyltransferase [Anaerolineales bacterium]|jgi:ribosomal-protein-alanine N-acetyltransferase
MQQVLEATIRPMTMDDIPVVVAIDRMSFPNPWPERSYIYELQYNPSSRLFVAEIQEDDDLRVVGFIGFWFVIDEAHISTVAVHPDFRGYKLGDRLLARALSTAKQMGGCLVSLEVRESNLVAQGLYNKYGFRQVGRRKSYYRDNNEDAIIMSLDDLSQRPDALIGGTE